MEEHTAIDAFCGPGGMSLGLRNAGFEVKLAFDIDPTCVETYAGNLPCPVEVSDICDMSAERIIEKTGIRPGKLDLLAGGPPCQGFSKQKKGAHLGDERNDLVLEFALLVAELKPRFFLFENVAIFGQKRGRCYLRKMKEILKGYDFYPDFYDSADFGLAQTRQRFVLVGFEQKLEAGFSPPAPSRKPKTVGEVLAGLPEPPEDYSDHPDFPNHQRARVTKRNIERFSHVPQGGGWQDIPYDLRIEAHKKVDPKKGGWPDVYGRLEWDGQCPTITGGFDSFTRGRFGHPLQDRPLTPREAARLQGFPDSFVFNGTRADIRSQIGNAVPPPLAEGIGKAILASAFGDNTTKGAAAWLPASEPELQLSLFS